MFEFRLSIWFVGLPIERVKSDVLQVLKSLETSVHRTEQGFECWYTSSTKLKGSSGSRNINGMHLRRKCGPVHFDLPVWKKCSPLLVSDTFIRFKKLEGNIEDFENLIELVVCIFEST